MRKEEFVVGTFEGIQLCVLNAERLLDDSKADISEPTRAALMELSLEEIAKGYILLFDLIRQYFEKIDRDKLQELFVKEYGKELSARLDSLSDQNKAFFDETMSVLFKPVTIDQFGRHRPKLKYLAQAVKMLAQFIPIMFETADPDRAKQRLGEYIDWERAFEKTIAEASQKTEAIFSKIKIENLDSLTRVKEDGFYVDYRNGHFVSPSMSTQILLMDEVKELAELLIVELKAETALSQKFKIDATSFQL